MSSVFKLLIFTIETLYDHKVRKNLSHRVYKENCFKLNYSTSALVSEILTSVLQTVQKTQQFTYGQYIFTDCTEDNVQNTHTYTQYTQCTIKTYLIINDTLYTVCTRPHYVHIYT